MSSRAAVARVFLVAVVTGAWWGHDAAAQSPIRVPTSVAADATAGPVRVVVRLAAPTMAADLAHPSGRAIQRAVVAQAQSAVLTRLAGHSIRDLRRFSLVPGFAAEVDQAALLALAATPGVAAIEADRPMPPLAITRTQPMPPSVVFSVPLVQAPLLWEQQTEGTGWTIAILDTGIDTSHPFLRGKVIAEACFSSNVPTQNARSLCPGGATTSTAVGSGRNCTQELDSSTDDCHHGTHVAGIAAGNDGTVYGVARASSLLSIQVFSHVQDPSLCAPHPSCLLSYSSDQIRALEHVLSLAGTSNVNRVAAVNMSLGAGHFSTDCDGDYSMIKAAVDQLRTVGIPSVIASGNGGDPTGISAPACVSSSVSVGSTTTSDQMSAFTNRSPQLALVAPGSGIVSSIVGGGFAAFSGTSMAAPHVAGAWALLKERKPSAGVDAVLSALRATGRPVADTSTGLTFPRINVADAAGALGTTASLPGAPMSLAASLTGTTVVLTWEAPASGGSASGYVILAGSSPGGIDVGAFHIGPVHGISALVSPGQYFVRIAAVNSAGQGTPSSEISFIVGDGQTPTVPGAPSGLIAEVAGATVTLRWIEPVGGVSPTGYLVEAGSAPGGSDLAMLTVGRGNSVVVTSVLPGNYYVRVRAENTNGHGAASNEIIVVVH